MSAQPRNRAPLDATKLLRLHGQGLEKTVIAQRMGYSSSEVGRVIRAEKARLAALEASKPK